MLPRAPSKPALNYTGQEPSPRHCVALDAFRGHEFYFLSILDLLAWEYEENPPGHKYKNASR